MSHFSYIGPHRGLLTSVAALLFLSIAADSEANTANKSSKGNFKQISLDSSMPSGGKWWNNRKRGSFLHVIVDKSTQEMKVYENGKLVTRSNVSTGKAGHTTPSGIFSVLGKKRRHYSNLYNSAPMPYMQRLTWSGIALHESGHVPSYPASHGCVRMPGKFANKLFKYTNIGAQVFIANHALEPQRFQSDGMFAANKKPSILEANLRPSLPLITGTVDKNADKLSSGRENPTPIKLLITREPRFEKLRTIQRLLKKLHYDVGAIDGRLGRQTSKAILEFQKDYRHKPTGSLTPELLAQLQRATGTRPFEPGRIYIRRNQRPLFDVPVRIQNAEIGLGTHHFALVDGGTQPNFWISTTSAPTRWQPKGKKDRKKQLRYSSAREAIERIVMDEEIRSRIEKILVPGSTVIIADKGWSRETGKGTDFIVLTQ